jgi:pSer/pThr/pTyr-binding forkhead associated (FHA) protein
MHIVLKFNDSVIRQINSDKGEITIGRDPETDIQIDNISVSRVHAKILKGPNRYILHDLSSTNGTFVNGKKIKKRSLKEDDVITIGKHTLLIDINNSQKQNKMWSSSQTDRTYKLKNSSPTK